MKHMMAITLQTTIAQVGPIPEKYSDMVRTILTKDDPALLIALGMYLDDCRTNRSYDILKNLESEIDNRNEENEALFT